MLKRMLAMFLCLTMVITMVPVQAIALETEEPAEMILETEPAEEETEPVEEVTEPVEEETEPVEEETEPAGEETEPAAAEPEELHFIALETPEMDSEELLMGYLSPIYKDGGISTFGTMARDRLSGPDRHLYDGLVERIIQIANGEEDYTRVDVSFQGSGYSGGDVDIDLVQEALLLDFAYEMYWYYGCWFSRSVNSVAFIMQPNKFYLPSEDEFSPNNPYIDISKTRKASAAAANIDDIIDSYKTASDYDKLCGYADEICALVEYDYDAAENSSLYPKDNRSWTLVNVFDGDEDTNVVCEGYAEAYQYLCDESDFQGDVVCISVTGNNHKWNIVRIDGVGYLMDVTHCDYGDYAYRGQKFLDGGSGSVSDGYYIGGFYYWYDSLCLEIFGDGADSVLKLSPVPYTPAGTYVVVYSVDGDTGLISSQTKTEGVDLTLTDEVPYILGYNFIGWVVSPTATEPDYQPGDIYSEDAGIVLYALFEESDVITGSEPGSSWVANVRYPSVTVLYTFRPEISGSYRIYSTTDNDPVVDIYDADGQWIVGDDDSGGNFQFQLNHNFQAGEVYYIDVWYYNGVTGELPFHVSRRLTISYDANGGTGAPAAEYQYYQFPTALSDVVPTRGEDTFLGWATSPAATEAEYQPYDTYYADDDVTLYAVWQKAVCSHSFGDYVVTKDAACEEPGMQERTCSLCGAVESQEIPAKGHNKVTIPGVAATCTTDGLTDGLECTSCGEVFVKQEVIPAGHTIEDGICTVCRVNGTCGEDVTWAYDTATGTLTISGAGGMRKYTASEAAPWYLYRESITDVVIENGITILGAYAFADCTALTRIALPSTITKVDKPTCQNCTSLTDIYITDMVSWAAGTFTALMTCNDNGKNLYLNGELVVDLVIPEGTEAIGASAFRNCSSLRSIIVPDSVQSIGNSAFSQCTSLQTVALPDNLTTIGAALFNGCTSLSSVKLPKNLTGIDNGVFSGSGISSIDLPDSITSIGTRAFFGCKNLNNVTLPKELVTIGQEAFYGCTDLTSITVPAKLADIGNGAFEACRKLRDIHITDLAVWVSGDLGHALSSSHGNELWLYLGDELLTDVVIPDGVTTIGSWAFANCTQITSVTLPDTISSIGEYAFLAHEGTGGISEIFFQGDAPEFAEKAFTDTIAAVYYLANNSTWTTDAMQDYGGTLTWVPYGGVENRITIPAAELEGRTTVWIDGREYPVSTGSGMPYVDLPDGNAGTMVVYTYGESNGKSYPMGMKVWLLSNTDGFYTATRAEALDDILGYEGCSIRVDGKQGIRMITSVPDAMKSALISGWEGYTLSEYGTAVAWADQISGNRPLTLGKSYVSSNFAYSKAEGKDPIYAPGDRIQYTNVLVGFTLDQCADDLAMRSYMILKDADGNEITLYGGIVERSIGYIALQNQDTFAEGTDADQFVENIIDHVYGDQTA